MSKSEKEILLIDTDCGVDDAMALLLALSFEKTWNIIAVTCCHGNTTVDNACNNVLKILNICGKTNIPVYRGFKSRHPAISGDDQCHGTDGLGDAAHLYSSGSLQVQDEHAAEALVRIARQNKGRINLVALAPLTNIALAHRLDSEFTSNLKSMSIMGGNRLGIGNYSSAAEFNFFEDPESAHLVLSEAGCKTILVPWETTLEHAMSWEFYEQWINNSTPCSNFLKAVTKTTADFCKADKQPGFVPCDFFPMAATLCPDVLLKTEDFPVAVETAGRFTRGQAVVLRRKEGKDYPIVNIATEFDIVALNQLYNRILNIEMTL